MHIGELADKTGLSLRTIRHYDEVGLLKPSGRTEGGFRLYTQNDLTRLLLIRRMKPLGFSLDEMTDLLRVVDTLRRHNTNADPTTNTNTDTNTADVTDVTAVRAELDSFIERAIERRATLSSQLAMADEFLDLLRAQ
jgi:DNA-binding transcriptional MerR regulator